MNMKMNYWIVLAFVVGNYCRFTDAMYFVTTLMYVLSIIVSWGIILYFNHILFAPPDARSRDESEWRQITLNRVDFGFYQLVKL